jgi:hypothetical protein
MVDSEFGRPHSFQFARGGGMKVVPMVPKKMYSWVNLG